MTERDITFEYAIEHILQEEGGFTDDPEDDGNWTSGKKGKGYLKGTKWGISAASYPTLDIKNLTREGAKVLYHKDFWIKFKLESIPNEIRLHFFDVCINSGFSRAVKLVQRALDLTVDGSLGPKTRAAMPKCTMWGYAEQRAAFYVNHVKLNPSKIRFLGGWTIRVLSITKLSLI